MIPFGLMEVLKASLHSVHSSTSAFGSHLSQRQERPRKLRVAEISLGTHQHVEAASALPAIIDTP